MGLATGFAQGVQDNPEEGLHKKVPVPVAFKVVELPEFPEQMVASAPALIVGRGFIYTFTESEFVQPFASVPTTVYVIVAVVEETGFATEAFESVEEGDQT